MGLVTVVAWWPLFPSLLKRQNRATTKSDVHHADLELLQHMDKLGFDEAWIGEYHSLGATLAVGMDVLAHHWTIQEETAAKFGRVADRADWRLVGLMHLAETEEQAAKDVEYGMEQWFSYFQDVAAFPQMAAVEEATQKYEEQRDEVIDLAAEDRAEV